MLCAQGNTFDWLHTVQQSDIASANRPPTSSCLPCSAGSCCRACCCWPCSCPWPCACCCCWRSVACWLASSSSRNCSSSRAAREASSCCDRPRTCESDSMTTLACHAACSFPCKEHWHVSVLGPCPSMRVRQSSDRQRSCTLPPTHLLLQALGTSLRHHQHIFHPARRVGVWLGPSRGTPRALTHGSVRQDCGRSSWRRGCGPEGSRQRQPSPAG